MSLDAVKMLEISVTVNPKSEILEFIQKSLTIGAKKTEKVKKNASFAKKYLTIVTPNPEQMVLSGHDSHFRELLNQADVSLPDGIGIVWAGNILALSRQSVKESAIQTTIPGIEFTEDLVTIAAKQHVPIALIGGREGLALKTFDCLSKTHPGLLGWAIDGPEVKIENDEIQITSEQTDTYFQVLAKRIVDNGVRMVFVGLGAPKQEFFIERLRQWIAGLARDDKATIIFMSVGGSFDEISGRISRAPALVSRVGVKWLWRLVLEPWRIKRQLALIKFVWLVMMERYSLK